MSKTVRRFAFRLVSGVILIFLIALGLQQSESFSRGIKDRKHTEEYKTLHNGNIVMGSRTRLRLNYVCALEFTEKTNGAIVALATVALSVFTFTLWRATNRLWQASSDAVKLARDEFNASHRPRMKVREVAIATDGFDNPVLLGPDKTISARFAIANEGETEAKILEVRATIYKTEEPLPMRTTVSRGAVS